MKSKCREDISIPCICKTKAGYCNMMDGFICPWQEEVSLFTNVATINSEKMKPRSIIIGNCDEIVLAKDSIGLKVDIKITDFDQFETIEINGKKFKRIRE